MDGVIWAVHPLHMPRKQQKAAPPPKHFLRKWRTFLKKTKGGHTLVEVAADIGTTHATLSRVETGNLDYTQTLLEALSWRYQVSVADLLARDPGNPPTPKKS